MRNFFEVKVFKPNGKGMTLKKVISARSVERGFWKKFNDRESKRGGFVGLPKGKVSRTTLEQYTEQGKLLADNKRLNAMVDELHCRRPGTFVERDKDG
jgi:hypothetical protein